MCAPESIAGLARALNQRGRAVRTNKKAPAPCRASEQAGTCTGFLFVATSQSFLHRVLQVLRAIVPEALEADAATEGALLDRQKLLFCERFLEFAVDLLSQLPTRRFVRTLLDDRALLVKCRLSSLFKHHQGALPRSTFTPVPR